MRSRQSGPCTGRMRQLFRSEKQFPLFISYGRDFLLRNIVRQVRRIVERRRALLLFGNHAPMDPLVDVLLGWIVAVEKVAMTNGDGR